MVREEPIDPERHDDEREDFATAYEAFRNRLTYAFPNIQALDAEQLALAASWIADMEHIVLEARIRAEGYARHGKHELAKEAAAAQQELTHYKQAFFAQKRHLQRTQREQIAAINRERDAHLRRMREERRRMQREADEEIRRRRDEQWRRDQERKKRQHRDFMRTLRGDRFLGYVEVDD
ncbi:MAG: hypothetical protein SX243_23885 [Acidobacteriota bacterium]|nr:hypothetical protein [Acidobacteriota bacterium]